MAADGKNYKDAIIIATLKDDGNGALVLDIPFEIYACQIMCKGERIWNYPITNRPELLGQEVMADVHYMVYHANPLIRRNDKAKVKAFPGYVDEYKTDPRVLVHQLELNQKGNPKSFCVSGSQLNKDNVDIIRELQPDLAIELKIDSTTK